jgi:hypothetical protein
MSAKDILGTPVSLTLSGLTLRVAADTDPKDGKPQYKNEPVMTTGGAFRKMTLQDETSESWTIIANADEVEKLKAIAASTDDITMSYKNRAGDIYKATGFIDFDGHTVASGKIELKLTPRSEWAKF